MIRDLLMATHVDRDGEVEAEPLIVELEDDGHLTLILADSSRLELDYDELLAVGSDEQRAAAAHRGMAA